MTALVVLMLMLGGVDSNPAAASPGSGREPIVIRIPLAESRELDVGDLVAELAAATSLPVRPLADQLKVPVTGVGGTLGRTAIAEILGADARIEVVDGQLVVEVNPRVLESPWGFRWKANVRRLADHVRQEAQRQSKYGMRAFPSYRPNDPLRPTVCLVHGLNSSSGGFVHMIKPLEEAGYGVVVYDYPYNRKLSESSARFARDWQDFRRTKRETRPWAIVAHSMGALVARAFVEDPTSPASEFSSLILIAPVNQGSSLAKAQTFLQLFNGVQAIQNKEAAVALAHLGDGLGEAAQDLTPGSSFLMSLNRRPRRAGVPYHILAGDSGLVPAEARRKLEKQIEAMRRDTGLLGGFTRFATADLSSQLDEMSDGYGDGCVSVARSRIDGVTDHVVIHANHAELIRAPLLFKDPGPVACMPDLLRWLAQDLSVNKPQPPRG